MEGLNKDPTLTESALFTRVPSVPVVDSQGSAEGNGAAQFRSPLLRQMMGGNKLVTGGRPASSTNDLVASDVVESGSRDDTTAEETKDISAVQSEQSSLRASAVSGSGSHDDTTTEVSKDISTAQSDQSSIGVELSAGNDSASIRDQTAVCDEPLDPSPQISTQASHTSQCQDNSSTLRPIPIEVWTEESTTPASSSQSNNDRDGSDDKTELCIEGEPLDPSSRSEVDTCEPDRPDKCTSDSKPDASSSRSDHSGIDDRAEPSVEDSVPLEPSPSCSVDGRAASIDYFMNRLIDANNQL